MKEGERTKIDKPTHFLSSYTRQIRESQIKSVLRRIRTNIEETSSKKKKYSRSQPVVEEQVFSVSIFCF